MNTPNNSGGWTNAVSKAAWTLLLAVLVIYVSWQLVKQLLAPLVILLCLVGIIRFALGLPRRDKW